MRKSFDRSLPEAVRSEHKWRLNCYLSISIKQSAEQWSNVIYIYTYTSTFISLDHYVRTAQRPLTRLLLNIAINGNILLNTIYLKGMQIMTRKRKKKEKQHYLLRCSVKQSHLTQTNRHKSRNSFIFSHLSMAAIHCPSEFDSIVQESCNQFERVVEMFAQL